MLARYAPPPLQPRRRRTRRSATGPEQPPVLEPESETKTCRSGNRNAFAFAAGAVTHDGVHFIVAGDVVVFVAVVEWCGFNVVDNTVDLQR